MAIQKQYCTPMKNLSAADQLLLLEYSDFQAEVREYATKRFRIPYTKHEREIADQSKISKHTETTILGSLRRFHGWACIHEKKRNPKSISLRDLLQNKQMLYKHLTFLREDRTIRIKSLTKICEAVISMNQFILRDCAEKEKETLSKMIEEARYYMLYCARRGREADKKDRMSLCDLRDQGKALSFSDLVKVCRYQRKRFYILQRFHDNPDLSASTRKRLTPLLLEEVERLAVLVTLLRFPLRTNEVQQLYLKFTGKYSGRILVSADTMKRRKFPIDSKLSRDHAEIFRCLQECRGIMPTNTEKIWQPFDVKKSFILPILKKTTEDMTGVGATVQMLRTAAESHVELLGAGHSQASIKQSLSYAEGHSSTTADEFYKKNGPDALLKFWTDHVDELIGADSNASKEEKDDDGENDTEQRIDNAIKESQKRWLAETKRTVRKIMSGVQVCSSSAWTPAEDEELKAGVKKYGTQWKKILDASPLLQQREYTSVVHARHGLLKRWTKRLMKQIPPEEQKCCFVCGELNANHCQNRQWQQKKNKQHKCTTCCKKILSKMAEGNVSKRGRRKKKRAPEGEIQSCSVLRSSTPEEDIQSSHFPRSRTPEEDIQSCHFPKSGHAVPDETRSNSQ